MLPPIRVHARRPSAREVTGPPLRFEKKEEPGPVLVPPSSCAKTTAAPAPLGIEPHPGKRRPRAQTGRGHLATFLQSEAIRETHPRKAKFEEPFANLLRLYKH